MDIATASSVVQAVAVVIAVAFGAVQVRQFRLQQRSAGAFALMRSLQTRDVLVALLLLDGLPPGLSKAEIERRLGTELTTLQALLGTWEALGILVFRREVDLELVDDFYSGSIVHSWKKLGRLVEELRVETGRETRWEWFQWLAERMLERESATPAVPAHRAHAGWLPR
jgi:hypothetical protein